MEQFKKLNWSWNKYEEEKNHSPRVLNFETIKERDVLARTLNEIHKCVLPKEDEYRVFKSPEEIAEGRIQFGEGETVGIEDPRKNPTKFLKSSHELIKDYGYSTELNVTEQRTILNAIQLNITHNPSLIAANVNKQKRAKQLTLTPELIRKHQTEVTHFNKCAEIFFYRNIGELSLVSEDMKKFLVDRWSQHEDPQSYQVITMLLRDQSAEIELTLEENSEENFKKSFYTLSQENFFKINRFSGDDLKLYSSLKEVKREDSMEHDIEISLDTLAKLFADTEEFSVKFTNKSKANGKVFSSFASALPLKNVSIAESLREIAKISLHMEIDWCNMNKITTPQKSEKLPESQSSSIFEAKLMNHVMQDIYKAYKREAGNNKVKKIWKFAKDSQNFRVSVQHDVFYTSTQVPANISIKLEFQTKFGAEQMTREELLEEWCQMKFSPGSETFRFRIDAQTLEILSISIVNLQDVENELSSLYNTKPSLLLANLINILGCIQRLPENNYLIQAKLENDCKKLFIYKASDDGKFLDDVPWEVSAAFTGKWIPIDSKTPTFLHINHNFSPGCFPFKRSGLLSYTAKPQKNKKKKKPVLDPKVEAKKTAVIKKNLRKTEKRKKKMFMTLRKKQ